MQTIPKVKRIALPLTFSKDFESLLLNYPSSHVSLTHDIELAVQRALLCFNELEDVHDLTHESTIHDLIDLCNKHLLMESEYFKHWTIAIDEEILDELDLVRLTHGDDLIRLGLPDCTVNTLVVLLATIGVSSKNFS